MISTAEASTLVTAYGVARREYAALRHSTGPNDGFIAAQWERVERAIFDACNISGVFHDDRNAKGAVKVMLDRNPDPYASSTT